MGFPAPKTDSVDWQWKLHRTTNDLYQWIWAFTVHFVKRFAAIFYFRSAKLKYALKFQSTTHSNIKARTSTIKRPPIGFSPQRSAFYALHSLTSNMRLRLIVSLHVSEENENEKSETCWGTEYGNGERFATQIWRGHVRFIQRCKKVSDIFPFEQINFREIIYIIQYSAMQWALSGFWCMRFASICRIILLRIKIFNILLLWATTTDNKKQSERAIANYWIRQCSGASRRMERTKSIRRLRELSSS